MTKEEKIYLRTLCPKCSEFIDIEYVDEELQALCAWKAKARVILRHEYTVLKFNADMFEENQPEQDKKKLAILTHLLGDK